MNRREALRWLAKGGIAAASSGSNVPQVLKDIVLPGTAPVQVSLPSLFGEMVEKAVHHSEQWFDITASFFPETEEEFLQGLETAKSGMSAVQEAYEATKVIIKHPKIEEMFAFERSEKALLLERIKDYSRKHYATKNYDEEQLLKTAKDQIYRLSASPSDVAEDLDHWSRVKLNEPLAEYLKDLLHSVHTRRNTLLEGTGIDDATWELFCDRFDMPDAASASDLLRTVANDFLTTADDALVDALDSLAMRQDGWLSQNQYASAKDWYDRISRVVPEHDYTSYAMDYFEGARREDWKNREEYADRDEEKDYNREKQVLHLYPLARTKRWMSCAPDPRLLNGDDKASFVERLASEEKEVYPSWTKGNDIY